MTVEDYTKAKEIIANESKYSFAMVENAYYIVDKWEFANQRVIEELEKVISNLDSPWDRDMVRRRVKELMKIGANQKK